MFSREEAKIIRQEFWTAFGIYMRQHVPVAGTKLKWANYKTGIRHLYFRLDADGKSALVAIDMEHGDEGLRELFFEQWEELKMLLESSTGRQWVWRKSYFRPTGPGATKEISRIETVEASLSLFRREDWGAMFEFFAGVMVPLDELWADAKDVFMDLEG